MSTSSLQDQFLTQLVESNETVSIFLINGIRLEGIIASFDAYAIAIKGQAQDLVYKHAVSTIAPVGAHDIKHNAPRRASTTTRSGNKVPTRLRNDRN